MQPFDSITLSIAVLGAVLGLMNTFRAIVRDYERLVIKTDRYLVSDDTDLIQVKIINRGYVPVTIERVLFPLDRRWKRTNARGVSESIVFKKGCPGGGYLPKVIEPRTSFTLPVDEAIFKCKAVRHIRGACAVSACGRKFKEKWFVRKHVIPDSERTPAEDATIGITADDVLKIAFNMMKQ